MPMGKMYKYQKKKRKPRPKPLPRIPRYIPIHDIYSNAFNKAFYPPRKSTKLVYVGNFDINEASGLFEDYHWHANSVFDLDETSVGHNPHYFNQLNGIYSRYVVTACKIDFTLIPNGSTAASERVVFSVIPTLDPTTILASSDMNAVMEMPKVKSTFSNPYTLESLSHYMTSAQMFGVSKKTILSEQDYSGAINADPTNVWSWCIQTKILDDSTTAAVKVYFKATQYVTFYELKPQSQS